MCRARIARRERPSRLGSGLRRSAGPAGAGYSGPAARPRPFGPALAAVLAAALALLLTAGAAKAQTSVKLVSNTGQTTDVTSTFAVHRAQPFTTGSNAGGYTLTKVTFPKTGTLAAFTAEVRIESSGTNSKPGGSLGALTLTEDGTTATATTTGIALAANTTYFVVLEFKSGVATTTYDRTNSDSEDTGAAAGWSIGDGSLWDFSGVLDWDRTSTSSWKIAIHGYENPAPPRNSNSVTCAAPGGWQIGGYWHVSGLGYFGRGDRLIPCDMAKPAYVFDRRPGRRLGHIRWIFDGTPGFWDQGNLPPPYNQPVQSVSYTVPGDAAHRAVVGTDGQCYREERDRGRWHRSRSYGSGDAACRNASWNAYYRSQPVYMVDPDGGTFPGGEPPAAPMLQSGTVDGTTLTLTFDAALDAVSLPSRWAFYVTVKAGGAMSPPAASPSPATRWGSP